MLNCVNLFVLNQSKKKAIKCDIKKTGMTMNFRTFKIQNKLELWLKGAIDHPQL